MAQMQVFVSHNHNDTAFCQALVEGLRGAGADVWYDEHNMESGRLGPTIERELRARPVFVVVLSPDALQSQWVEDETSWAYGLYRNDPTRIIQPVTARTLNEDDIWLFLQDFKRIEASGSQLYPIGEAIRRLLHTLNLTPTVEFPEPTVPQPSYRAVPLEPGLADHGNDQGIHVRDINPTQMLDTYNYALTILPNSGGHWSGKGDALYDLTRYIEALDFYDRALALAPDFAAAARNRTYPLRALGRVAEAEAAERHAKELGG